MDATQIQVWVNTAAMVILGYLYVVKSNKSQVSEIDGNTIASLKRQIDAYTTEVSSYKQQMHEMTLKVGEQQGIIAVQKETIEKYERILQNRNPELTEVLKEIRDFMGQLMKSTDLMVQSDRKVMQELQLQTRIIKKEEQRTRVLDDTHKKIIEGTVP